MKHSVKLIAAVSACCAAAVAGYVGASQPKRPAYTLEWREVSHRGGEQRELYTETIHSEAGGKKRVVRNRPDGLQDEKVAPTDHRTATREELLSSPQFERTDTLLGYEAVVVRVGNSEFWRLPALGGDVAKVVHRDDAGHIVQVSEPVSIKLGEVP